MENMHDLCTKFLILKSKSKVQDKTLCFLQNLIPSSIPRDIKMKPNDWVWQQIFAEMFLTSTKSEAMS